MRIRNASSAKAGSMLLLVIMSLFMITTLTVGVLSLTTGALYSSRTQQFRANALNIAESGAEKGALWMRDSAYPPTASAVAYSAQSLAGGTYTVTINPDPANGTSFLKTYRVVSVGTIKGMSKKVEVVIRQASFGKFAYFTDSEKSAVSGSPIWWISRDKIDGPVHSNNTGGTNFNIDYSGWSTNNPTRPIFMDNVTGCGSSINYSPSKPTTETAFKKVYLNGSKGYKLGVPRIELPPSTARQQEAAWGGTAGFPAVNGVYVRSGSSGGVYIRGDSKVQLALDAGGNQKITITQGTNITVLTMNLATGTTTYTGPVGAGSSPSGSGLPNGVVYCTGNITSLAGTVADNRVSGSEILARSALTIATDATAGKNITVTGNIVYNTRPDKTKPDTDPANVKAGTLGLVACNIKIADDGTSQHNHPNREIDAVCMAGSQTVAGSFGVNYYNYGSVGTLKVIGGLIQSNRGPVGTFSGSSITHGYSKDYSYDTRLAQNPPPFYPTTGQYDRVSWRTLPN